MTLLKKGTYLLVLILPVLYLGSNILYPHITPKTFFFYGIIEILTAVWIYNSIIKRNLRISKNLLLCLIPLSLYIIWMTLATIFAVNPELAFWSSFARGTGLLTIYHSFLFLCVVVCIIKNDGIGYINKLLQWFIAGGFLLALSIWFGSTGFNIPLHSLQTDTGGGLSGNSSLAGGYLLIVLAFGAFLLVSKLSKKNKWWIGIAMALILFSPLFINIYGFFVHKSIVGTARGALLGIFVSIGIAFIMWLLLAGKKLLRMIGIGLTVTSVFAFALLWTQLMTPGTVIHQKFTEAASGTRFIFWSEAQKAMDDRPWFGFGPDNYMIAFEQYFDPEMLLPKYNYEGWNDRAHNVYYDTGVAGGYPAIAFYFLFILSILYALYNSRKNMLFSSTQISILGGVVIGYVFQNLFYFDSVLSSIALFALAGIAYASVDYVITRDQKNKKDRSSIDSFFRNLIAFVLASLCVVSFMYFSYRPLQKAKAYIAVLNTNFNKPFDQLLVGSTMGDQWDVSQIAHDVNNTFARDPLSIKNNKEVLSFVLKDLTGMLAYLEEVAKTNKTDFRLYISMVHLYNTKIYLDDTFNTVENRNRIHELLEHAKELSPTNPQVYWDIAQVHAWAGNKVEIVKAYHQAIALDPHIPNSYELLLKFAKAINDQKLYAETLSNAENNVPGFTFK